MSTSSRLTEKWINRGLWVIAFAFAGFLIGLGSLVVEDLPRVQKVPRMEDYLDRQKYSELKANLEQKEKIITAARKEREKEYEKVDQLNRNYSKSKETFNNWISTRQSTQDSAQNSEVLNRTKELENQQGAIKVQEQKVKLKDEEITKLQDDEQITQDQIGEIEKAAYVKVDQENKWNQIKVFLYRLALTLPLLLIGAWLFVKKRKTQQWPFVWGFIFFALFAFFVELVPYLPSYGGYVRYIVGIVVTYFIGRYSIQALQTYLENQRKAEAQPNTAMKEKINYDLAHQRLSRNICPGCERPIDPKDVTKNFCMHCGTCLFNNCTKCQARKNAFAKYCHSCGEVG